MYQGNIWRASTLVALALVMPALSGVTANTAFAADKLRVGKAQAQPFTKVTTEKYLPGAPQ